MAIDIKFDLVGNPESPTIILANRNGNKLGLLDVNQESIDIKDKFNDASEFSFNLNKYYFDEEEKIEKITNLWDKVVDFKLVYCEEWDMWFEIKVELDEETEAVKTVFCTQLGQAELSQIKLYNIHINEEGDSNWNVKNETYKSTILYNENDLETSLLHRLLKDKAPHYSIIHVDDTIKKEQRTFSFDNISIYDAFQEIAEEIGCLFIFNSNSDENGKIQRTISVYDLQQNCLKCGHRGEFTEVCTKCEEEVNGDYGFKFGYGEDTLIFVTSDELASNGIELTTDVDSVKNCFKLEAGDELMTATVRNCNPNGTDYIWRFSTDTKDDMSKELSDKIKEYDDDYKKYYNDYESNVDSSLLNKYNAIIDKYSEYNKNLKQITTPIKGYSSLMNAYYDVIDLSLYLESSLMPSVEISGTTAKDEVKLLTASSLSPIAVANIDSVSLNTADSVVLSMAKIIVRSTYKVEVNTSSLSEDDKIWTGSFVVTNYSDEKDTAISNTISVQINGDNETFIKQKIEKALNKENTDDLSITGLFEKEYDDFCLELRKYALNPLVRFRDACQACIDILTEQGVGNKTTWSDTTEGSEANLHEKLYVPYYNKLKAIESEIKIRENEVNIVKGVYDENNILKTDGMKTHIEELRNVIQDALNFEKYLGEELWLEFCCYRREDTYSNDNYISDGLTNAELFERALKFIEVANNEIYKASELQHSISTNLNNLLAIEKFKPLVKSFNVGNWIRVQVDDVVYKLRLLEYGIDFGDFDNISVEFSDVTKIKNGATDVRNVLSQASSMASSYDSVKRQAVQGEKSNIVLNEWMTDGLNATNTKIVGAENQNQIWDKNGILCREYDPITETYSDEQLKIINKTIAITDDNWKTTKTAIGKYYYVDPITKEMKSTYGINGETIVGKLLIGENMSIQNESGSLSFDDNGLIVRNGNNSVTINPKAKEVMNIMNGEDKVFNVNEDGELSINGNIIARSLKLENGVKIDSGVITDLATVATSGSYEDLIDTPTKLSDFENDTEFVAKNVSNLDNYYNKTNINTLLESKVNANALSKVATSGSYKDLSNAPTKLTEFNNDAEFITKQVDNLDNYYNKSEISNVATTGSYKDLVDIEEFKTWILEQIQSAI